MSREELNGFIERIDPLIIQPGPISSQDAPTLDWSEVISWAVGNSISVDQSTVNATRRVLKEMENQKLEALRREEIELYGSALDDYGDSEDSAAIYDNVFQEIADADPAPEEGLTYSHLYTRYGAPHHRNGAWKSSWRNVCQSLLWMLENGLAYAIDHEGSAVTIEQYDQVAIHLQSNSGNRILLTPIWNAYIYARYSVEINGAWRLHSGPTGLRPVVQVDVVVVLGETLARAFRYNSSEDDFVEHGLNQYIIRQMLCELAIGRGEEQYVTVSEYYDAFRRHSAGHMADSYMLRQYQDSNAAIFRFEDTPAPELGRFYVDPRLVRWREWNRSRGRQH